MWSDSKFKKVHEYFLETIGLQLDRLTEKHVWLEGIKNIFESKLYIKGMFEDALLVKNNICGKNILDLGTGSGYFALLLAELGYTIKGIDITYFKDEKYVGAHDTMVYDQRLIWPIFEKKYANLKFSHYNGITIPFPDSTFDCVTVYAVLEHVPSEKLDGVMAEIRRVLKPEGHLFISRLPRKLSYSEFIAKVTKLPCHDKLFWYSEIEELLKKHGFVIEYNSITDIFPAYPTNIINFFYPLLNLLEKILKFMPIKYVAHDMVLISKKEDPHTT